MRFMELTIEGIGLERDYRYKQDIQECTSVIRESGALDYACAAVLLRNLGERKDTTSLEREALSAAVRLLRQNIGAEKQ